MIYDSINAYHLEPDDLREFLERLFPDESDSIEIKKQPGCNEFRLKIPRELSEEERDEIDEEVRYEPA